MNKELFKDFNEKANYNLGIRGNLAEVIVSYMNLAKGMGAYEKACEKVSDIPFEGLNNKNAKLDAIANMYNKQEYTLENRIR